MTFFAMATRTVAQAMSSASVRLARKEGREYGDGRRPRGFGPMTEVSHFMSFHPKYCTLLYCVSCLLDAVDGHAARALGQTSKFGAVLDMVTDRCTTAGLLCFLSSAYPSLALLFQFLIALDFSSHYMHMYSSLVTGSRSHKIVTSDVSRILRYYYNDPLTLFLFCAGNELFFVSLYLMKWDTSVIGPNPRGLLPAPYSLPSFLANRTLAELMALATVLVAIAKNAINVVQIWKASKILVGIDLAERARDKKLAQRGQKKQ